VEVVFRRRDDRLTRADRIIGMTRDTPARGGHDLGLPDVA
jgi:hypothetical protein